MNIYTFLGIIGLLLTSASFLVNKRSKRDFFAILGGLCLLLYSIHIEDILFIVLQIIFIIVVGYDRIRNKNNP